jgi:hypothetical protein
MSPTVTTTYVAEWRGAISRPITIRVGPRLILTETHGRLAILVQAANTVPLTVPVELQRWDSGQWITFRHVTARRKVSYSVLATATLTLALPPGIHRLRAQVTSGSAGSGYVGSTSSAIKYRS